MAKVIAFPISSLVKFGFKPVRKKRITDLEKHGQLNLFASAKIVNLNKLSPFEEALLLDEQHDARSKDLYLKAIRQHDSIADAYCNLGILSSEKKDFAQAIDHFSNSLKEDPRHYESHYNLANVYAEVGNLLLAKLHYQLSISIEPTFPNSYFNLALTLIMNSEKIEARQYLLEYKRLVSKSEQKQADELIENLSLPFS